MYYVFFFIYVYDERAQIVTLDPTDNAKNKKNSK